MQKKLNLFKHNTFLTLASILFIAFSLGCGKPKEVIPPIVYEVDPSDCESDINWTPDVLHPISWGVQYFEQEYGAPRDLAIYYPSCHVKAPDRRTGEVDLNAIASGSNPPPIHPTPMLKMSTYKYPVVVLLHGDMPYYGNGVSSPSHGATHRMWWRLASTLASSGFVVVVPRYEATLTGHYGKPKKENVKMTSEIINWVRTKWRESPWVNQSPKMTAVIGHSNGAILGAKVSVDHSDFGAFVSLGAQYSSPQSSKTLDSIKIPSLFMWSNSIDSENLDRDGVWNGISQPKYKAVYTGSHFDYLEPADTGTLPRGSCSHMPSFSADLITLFVSKYLQYSSLFPVPTDLSKPVVTLTNDQSFYANGYLQSFSEINSHIGCSIDLQWVVNGLSNSKRFGPP
jgi:alpha/beta superfamily hydrolase